MEIFSGNAFKVFSIFQVVLKSLSILDGQLARNYETLYGGPGTRDHWPNGPRDQGPLHLGPGPLAKFSLGPGTKAVWSRDWDQGPHDKNWMGPGTKWKKTAGTREHRTSPYRVSSMGYFLRKKASKWSN